MEAQMPTFADVERGDFAIPNTPIQGAAADTKEAHRLLEGQDRVWLEGIAIVHCWLPFMRNCR